MAIEVTIDDPGTYTQPFTTVGRATLMPGQELLEYVSRRTTRICSVSKVQARGPGGR